jgi:hypothetical protein
MKLVSYTICNNRFNENHFGGLLSPAAWLDEKRIKSDVNWEYSINVKPVSV